MLENIRRDDDVGGSSNRAFGLVFAAIFLLIALFPILSEGRVSFPAMLLSAVFALAALAFPELLSPLNILWTRVGLLLHKVTSPIVLGVMFFLIITPIGLIMRNVRKDPLRLKPDHQVRTYWIKRVPPGPRRDSFKDQF